MPDFAKPAVEAAILVVDADSINRQLVEAILRRSGFTKVRTAHDGIEALAIIETGTVDCVLLDVLVPGMDGLELCRRVRANPHLAGLPMLVQTAQMDRDDLWSAFAAGATDVIRKPFDPRELLARIHVHAAAALMSRQLQEDREAMRLELAEAAALVETILPQAENLEMAREAGIGLSWYLRPCFTVGGDHWGTWRLDEDRLAIFFADVSGHGIAAALRAFALHSLLSPPPPFAADPARVAEHLNRRLLMLGQRQFHYVAAMYGVFDRKAGTLTYVAGGLRDGVLLRPGREPCPVPMHGLPLGLVEECRPTLRRLDLAQGDRLLLYSDALVEHFGDRHLTEAEIQPWLAERAASCGPQDDLAARVAQDFLAENPDCSDDLLVVAASFPGFPPPDGNRG